VPVKDKKRFLPLIYNSGSIASLDGGCSTKAVQKIIYSNSTL
jgi:hypothetical protein